MRVYRAMLLSATVWHTFGCADALWVGSTSGDGLLTTPSNWSPATVPTGAIAQFDPRYPGVDLSPSLPASPETNFSVTSFEFLFGKTPFSFTINGPSYLTFTGAAIEGYSSLANIQALNEQIDNPNSQIVFRNPSTTVLPGDAVISANNKAAASISNSGSIATLAQLFFDGSGGLGSTGNIAVQIQGICQLTAVNRGAIANGNLLNDLAQIAFDGSGGASSTGSGSGSAVVTIGGTSVLSASNFGSIENPSYNNDVAQILFDGSGGFSSSASGSGSMSATIRNTARISATNSGNINGQYYSSNDIAQILFDGSGGNSDGASGSGTLDASVSGSVRITADNTGSIQAAAGIDANDLGQIIFDGSGGTNLSGPGTGSSTVSLSGKAYIQATNSGDVTNDSSTIHNLAQIIFDGSAGLDRSYDSAGFSDVSLNDQATLSATNSGSISGSGTTDAIGQILFDGRAGSSMGSSGSSTLGFDTTTLISATNTGAGTVDGDQIAFYETAVYGDGVIEAINRGGSVQHGVAFYGASTIADNARISLEGTSLWIDPALSGQFTIGALDGDASSSVLLNQAFRISMSNNTVATFLGVISDESGSNAFTLTGFGTQIFGGDNTYGGDTVVDMGTLVVNGSLASSTVTVSSGAKLAGSGSILALDLLHAAYLSAGYPLGTLNCSDATFDTAVVFQVHISPTQASLLDASGSAAVDGSVEVEQLPGTFSRTGEYLILQTGGGITGSFSPTVTGGYNIGGSPGYRFTLQQRGDDLYLLYQSAIPTSGLKGNSLKIANYLNEYGSGATISPLNDTTEAELKEALYRMSPSRNSFGTYTVSQLAFSLSSLLSSRLDNRRLLSPVRTSGESYAALLVNAANTIPGRGGEGYHRYSGWISAFGQYAYQQACSQTPSFHFVSEGLLGGVDYMGEIGQVAGTGFGYAHTHFYDKKAMGHAEVHTAAVSAYGNYSLHSFYLAPVLWGFWSQIQNRRTITFHDFSSRAKANIYSWQLVPHLEVGYEGIFQWGEAIPFTSVDWAVSFQNEYSEKGAFPYNARQHFHASSLLKSETGLKFCEKWETSWGDYYLKQKISYVFEKPFGVGTVSAAFVGNPGSFSLSSLKQTLNLIDLDFHFYALFGRTKTLQFDLGYEAQAGSRFWSNELMATLSKDF